MKPTTGGYIDSSAKRIKRKRRGDTRNYTLPTSSLSPGEVRVCKLLTEGLSVKEAAGRLNVSINTAETQRRSAYQKLGIHNRAGLVTHFAQPNVKAVRDTLTESIFATLRHRQNA